MRRARLGSGVREAAGVSNDPAGAVFAVVHPDLASPLKARIVGREIGGDLILHDDRGGSVHRLNSVAALIWQLCDGTRDSSAIASEVAALFEKSPADVAQDVDEILGRFTKSGLIQWQVDPVHVGNASR